MGKNLKDLIDKAEEEEKSQAQLEKTVESLELKVAKLETKLRESQSSSKFELAKPSAEIIESEEINILKNLINSQNQELTQRNREKEALQNKISDLNAEIVNLKESINDSIKDQVILKTQNSLNNLIEDYGRLENTNKTLEEKILEIESENEQLKENATTLKTESSNVEQLEYNIKRLKKQLKDLEEVNKMLENRNLTLKGKELSIHNLEKTLQNLEITNSELKNQNQNLVTKLDAVKAERFQLTKFEAKATNLEKEIQALKIENEELKKKDAILLANTINTIETHKKESPKMHEILFTREKRSVEKPEIKIEEKFIEESTFQAPPEPERELIPMRDNLTVNKISVPEDLSLKNEMQKEESVTRKKTCPNCGNTNKAQIREFDDKSKIIYTYPRIYAKMYRCGQCGTEWR
ncbi:MAG: hypothetical protein HWN79_12710 [Candidatus Lokiarchaeota archaeon]|nr:hypothetical protein [Candidatus Lokiarchaeota archaeon]